MAGNSIRINTDSVDQIATNLEELNKKLTAEIETARESLEALKNIWTGEAATEATSAFASFAETYFQTYDPAIQEYVTFLRNAVAAGYVVVENANIGLADAFK